MAGRPILPAPRHLPDRHVPSRVPSGGRPRTREHVLTVAAWLAAVLVVSVAAVGCGYLLWRGVPTLGRALFFGDTPPLLAMAGLRPVWDGIWPACAGSLYLVGLATLLVLGPGVGCGIYLAEYAGPRARRHLGLAVELLAGVPSIVMGLFGFTLILVLRRTFVPQANTCLLLAAGCLALLVLPPLVVSTRAALESLPQGLRLTGAALGLTRKQTVFRVLLPEAGRGILGGVMLAVGRAAEDTAVILLTGVVANAGLPAGLLAKFEALPFTIYYTAAQYQTEDELARGFGAALVLLALSGSMMLGAGALQRVMERRHKGEDAWN